MATSTYQETANATTLPEAAAAVATMVCDPMPAVREEGFTKLQALLQQVDGLVRTEIVAEWSTSEQRYLREAIAKALCDDVPVLGGPSAIEQLAQDRVADIRRLAAIAAGKHLREAPARYLAVLARLTTDEWPNVRLAAINSLKGAFALGLAAEVVPILAKCVASYDELTAENALAVLST